jgi:hypothetical protein
VSSYAVSHFLLKFLYERPADAEKNRQLGDEIVHREISLTDDDFIDIGPDGVTIIEDVGKKVKAKYN